MGTDKGLGREIEVLSPFGSEDAIIPLRGNRFANPAGLVELIQRNAGTLKLHPDQKIVYLRNWEDEKTPPRGRHQAIAGSGQDRPRHQTRSGHRAAGADPGTCQAGDGQVPHPSGIKPQRRGSARHRLAPALWSRT
jgi:hypothetical protein